MERSWRRLTFYQHAAVTDPNGRLVEKSTARCALGGGGLAVADAHGNIHVLSPSLTTRATIAAHASVTHIMQPAGSKLVVSMGLEPSEGGGADRTFLRVWKPDAGDGSGMASYSCARSLKVFSASTTSSSSSDGAAAAGGGASGGGDGADPTITSCAIADDLSQIAIGLADGSQQVLTRPNGHPSTMVPACTCAPQAMRNAKPSSRGLRGGAGG